MFSTSQRRAWLTYLSSGRLKLPWKRHCHRSMYLEALEMPPGRGVDLYADAVGFLVPNDNDWVLGNDYLFNMISGQPDKP